MKILANNRQTKVEIDLPRTEHSLSIILSVIENEDSEISLTLLDDEA